MKITKTILLLLLLIGMTTSTYAQQINADQQKTGKYTTKRSSVLSTALSALTIGFGGGQYYNKQYLKAGILSAISAGGAVILITSGNNGLDDLADALGGALMMTVSWAYSIIDAPISSASINKRHNLNTKVSFSPAIERNLWDTNAVNLGLKVTLSLD